MSQDSNKIGGLCIRENGKYRWNEKTRFISNVYCQPDDFWYMLFITLLFIYRLAKHGLVICFTAYFACK